MTSQDPPAPCPKALVAVGRHMHSAQTMAEQTSHGQTGIPHFPVSLLRRLHGTRLTDLSVLLCVHVMDAAPWPGLCRHTCPHLGAQPHSQVENMFVPRTPGEMGLQGLFWVRLALGLLSVHPHVPRHLASGPAAQASQSSLPPASRESPAGGAQQPLPAHLPQVPADSCSPALQLLHPPATQVLGDCG